MNVLIVKDSAATDPSLLDALGSRFAEVRWAGSAREAMEQATRRRPDLVITAFPVVNASGESVTALLRRDPRTSTCRIIAYSEWCWPRTRDKAMEHGCDAFVPAHAPVEDLLAEIDHLLERTPGEAVRAARPSRPRGVRPGGDRHRPVKLRDS